MIQHPPVRPPATFSNDGSTTTVASSSTSIWHPEAPAQEEEDSVNLKEALVDQPIVGVEQLLPEEDQGPTARPMRSPKPMTLAEKEVHDLTHQPLILDAQYVLLRELPTSNMDIPTSTSGQFRCSLETIAF